MTAGPSSTPAGASPPRPPPRQLRVHLVGASDVTATASVAPVQPRLWYVIVGRGFAAMVNHATLRKSSWGRERLGDLPVLHIGFPDPWSQGHADLPMGQAPHLLTMPGYRVQPDAAASTRLGDHAFLHIGAFAAATRAEFAGLTRDHPGMVEVLEGHVGLIEARDAPLAGDAVQVPGETISDEWTWGEGQMRRYRARLNEPWKNDEARYRLSVYLADGTMTYVYAAKIDLCTGLNPARHLGLGSQVTDALVSGYVSDPHQRRKPLGPSLVFRGGHSLLSAQHPWPAPGSRICIYGGGTTSDWAADYAVRVKGLTVLWAMREANVLRAVVLPSTRNDGHYRIGESVPGAAALTLRPLRRPGDFDAKDTFPRTDLLLLPETPGIAVVEHHQVAAITPAGAGLDVAFTPGASATHFGHHGGLADPAAPAQLAGQLPKQDGIAQVLASVGSESSADIPGTAAYMTRLLGAAAVIEATFEEPDGLAGISFRTDDVRILGAAAQSHPATRTNPGLKAKSSLQEFENLLPWQSRVAQFGIGLNGLCIALANRYDLTDFGTSLNINFASTEVIASRLGVNAATAKKLITLRASLVAGFATPADLIEAIVADARFTEAERFAIRTVAPRIQCVWPTDQTSPA